MELSRLYEAHEIGTEHGVSDGVLLNDCYHLRHGKPNTPTRGSLSPLPQSPSASRRLQLTSENDNLNKDLQQARDFFTSDNREKNYATDLPQPILPNYLVQSYNINTNNGKNHHSPLSKEIQGRLPQSQDPCRRTLLPRLPSLL